jgi:hypothetical protein
MARQDVIDLLVEHHTGLIDEEQLLRFLDQIECSNTELEEADEVLTLRRLEEANNNPSG